MRPLNLNLMTKRLKLLPRCRITLSHLALPVENERYNFPSQTATAFDSSWWIKMSIQLAVEIIDAFFLFLTSFS